MRRDLGEVIKLARSCTPEDREKAIYMNAMRASSDGETALYESAEIAGVEFDSPAYWLSELAWGATEQAYAYPLPTFSEWRRRFAEVEALLRSGWKP